MRKSLLEAAEKADAYFHGGGKFEDRCKDSMELLKRLSNEWVSDGFIRKESP